MRIASQSARRKALRRAGWTGRCDEQVIDVSVTNVVGVSRTAANNQNTTLNDANEEAPPRFDLTDLAAFPRPAILAALVLAPALAHAILHTGGRLRGLRLGLRTCHGGGYQQRAEQQARAAQHDLHGLLHKQSDGSQVP